MRPDLDSSPLVREPPMNTRSNAARQRSLTRRTAPRRIRLHLEHLERRLTPSAFVVTTAADAGAGSLRQAVLDAAGNGQADTITFDNSLSGRTITLSSD